MRRDSDEKFRFGTNWSDVTQPSLIKKSVKYFDKRLRSENECCSTLFFSHRPKTRDENLEIYEWKSFRLIGGGQIPLESMTRQVEYLLPTHFINISGTFYIFIYLFIWFPSLYLYFTSFFSVSLYPHLSLSVLSQSHSLALSLYWVQSHSVSFSYIFTFNFSQILYHFIFLHSL